MANTTGTGEGDTTGLATVGREGDSCEQCGWPLAADQRYCLNCGRRRGEARVDYERRLSGTRPATNGAAPAAAAPVQQWTPAFAILAIALLGVMLLLGVLIGKKDSGSTQTVAAQTPATTTTAAAPTDTTATTASNNKSKSNNKPAKTASKPAAGTAPGQGNVVQGGTGSTQGVQAANTNASEQQNAKNGPDVVATQGPQEKLDPNGQAGGGSSATCIGC
jgi:hypothetical protein